MNTFCQSCGMPMKQDPDGGGTDADGGKNSLFCSSCYQNGVFTQPDIPAAEMQRFCIEKLREHGTPGWIGWLLTRSIPKLRRWRGNL